VGVYFGTRSGKVYGSANEGDKWMLISETLPPVLCVKVAQIEGKAKKNGTAKSAAKRKTAAKPKRARR
jgi:hypothetical protein